MSSYSSHNAEDVDDDDQFSFDESLDSHAQYRLGAAFAATQDQTYFNRPLLPVVPSGLAAPRPLYAPHRFLSSPSTPRYRMPQFLSAPPGDQQYEMTGLDFLRYPPPRPALQDSSRISIEENQAVPSPAELLKKWKKGNATKSKPAKNKKEAQGGQSRQSSDGGGTRERNIWTSEQCKYVVELWASHQKQLNSQHSRREWKKLVEAFNTKFKLSRDTSVVSKKVSILP